MKKEKEKKPFYKRWWFIVIAVIAFSGVVSSMNDDEEVATEEVEAEAEETASEEAIEENEDDSTTGEDNDVDNEETIEEEVNEEVEEEVVHEIPGTLGYDAEEFASRYNAASEELQVGWTIDEINVTEGEVQDVFQHQITPNVIINGTVNKADDSLREVTMIAQSDGSEDAAYDILFNMGLMIMATNPDLNENDRGEILEDIGFTEADSSEFSGETTRDGLRYSIDMSEMLGIMFFISDESDQ